MDKPTLIFWRNNQNRYSINALLGALETCELISSFSIFFFKKVEEIEFFNFSSPRFYSFSFSSFNFLEVKKIVSFLKLKDPQGIFLAGGPHPTGDFESTLDIGFDYVFRGEGEKIFPLFLNKKIKNQSIMDIPGLCFKKDKKIIVNKKKEVDFNDYLPFSKKIKSFGPLEITRGCPFACKYCQTSFIFGTKVRHRKLENVLEWVKFFKEQNLLDFRFITPNALAYGSKDGKEVNLEAIAELLAKIKEIAPQGRIFFGSFPSEVRPEQVSKAVLKLLTKWVDNKNLVIGAQSGSDRMLALSGRKHSKEDVLQAVKLAREFGFRPVVDFIFGLPGEKVSDEQKSIALMRKLANLGAKVHAHTFMPLPGTPWANKPPGKISPEIRREITWLIAKGLAFGNWEQQQKQAILLAKLKNRTPVSINKIST